MQLKDFRVETDTDVTLYLQDGSNRLVAVSELPEVLLKEDYEQVRQALALRSEFLQRHINTWVQPLVIAVAVVVISFGTAKAAQMVQTKMTQAKATPPTSVPTAADAAIIQSMLADSAAGVTTSPAAGTSNSVDPAPVTAAVEPAIAPAQPVTSATPASPALNRTVNTVAPVTTPITQTITKVPVVNSTVQGVTNTVTNTLPPALGAPVKNLLTPNK